MAGGALVEEVWRSGAMLEMCRRLTRPLEHDAAVARTERVLLGAVRELRKVVSI